MHRESIMVDGEGNLIQTVNHNLRRGTYLVVLSSARHQVTQRLVSPLISNNENHLIRYLSIYC
ncbi:MAG: hypothetical protein R3B93_12550 [Bacteroidia bacterium]